MSLDPSSDEQGSVLCCAASGDALPGAPLEQGWELPGAELIIPKWPKHCVLGHFEKSLCHPQDRENPSVVRASLERAGWDACGCSWAVLSQGEQEKG